MKSIIKALTIPLLTGIVFALHGKIIFYDGTYVIGKITKVDQSVVYIVPIGLDTSEGVLVGNVDSLKLENGMTPVINSAVKYFYQNGEFIPNNDDWMDEYDDFKYNDYATMQNEYKYESTKKTHQQYYQVSAFGGIPITAAVSLQEEDGSFKMTPNFGFTAQFPYYPIGALDISPGLKFMTYSFEASFQGLVQAVQLSPFASFDFKPILFFIPENIHVSMDAGLSINIGYDLNQDVSIYPKVESGNLTGNETYGGIGINFGGSIDYWVPNLPFACKLFFNNSIVPQAPPFSDESTMFSNIGFSLVVVLKRHHKNNSY